MKVTLTEIKVSLAEIRSNLMLLKYIK